MRRWLRRHRNHLFIAAFLGLVTTWASTWLLAAWFRANKRKIAGRVQSVQQIHVGSLIWNIRQDRYQGELLIDSRSFVDDEAAQESFEYMRDVASYMEETGQARTESAKALPAWAKLPHHLRREDDSLSGWTGILHWHVAFGWPMLAMRYEGVIGGTPPPGSWTWQRAIEIRGEQMPLAIIWPGFIANTLLYSAVWLALLTIPAPLRRHRRRRKGLCPQCAYELSGTPNAPCPECGK